MHFLPDDEKLVYCRRPTCSVGTAGETKAASVYSERLPAFSSSSFSVSLFYNLDLERDR